LVERLEEAVDVPGATNTLSVGKDEDFEQHDRMKLRSAPVLVGLLRVERFEAILVVEVVDSFGDELFKTVLSDRLREVLRKEVLLVLIVSNEVARHGWNLTQ
jgi:hypothetical protein